MASKTTPRPAGPDPFCLVCHQYGIVVVTLPNGRTLCFRCIRKHQPDAYENIVHWVIDHPPIDPT